MYVCVCWVVFSFRRRDYDANNPAHNPTETRLETVAREEREEEEARRKMIQEEIEQYKKEQIAKAAVVDDDWVDIFWTRSK